MVLNTYIDRHYDWLVPKVFPAQSYHLITRVVYVHTYMYAKSSITAIGNEPSSVYTRRRLIKT